MRVKIETAFERQGRILNKSRDSRYYYPMINAIIINKQNGATNSPNTEKFLIDTGAGISLLHPRNKKLFETSKPIESTNILFGTSTIVCNVYEVNLRVQGYEIEILAALVKGLKFKHSILGYFKGFDYFHSLVFNQEKKIIRMIKKY